MVLNYVLNEIKIPTNLFVSITYFSKNNKWDFYVIEIMN